MKEKGFVELLFGSFFRWWWAFITGFASLLSWVFVPVGITLSRIAVTILTVVSLTLLFLCVSTLYQSWLLYRNRLTAPAIVGYQRCDSYGGEFIFLIDGFPSIAQGRVAELKRFVGGVEVSFALVELMERNSKGQFQARPIWISPIHLRDLRMNQFVYTDIIVDPLVQLRTISASKDNLIEQGVYNEQRS
ncbi:MAG: hypothetical protein E3K37_02950 [Candidatus Kuenenia sp.]|nr:hypothetical protein [Candidatus Kuenenia hertensis]